MMSPCSVWFCSAQNTNGLENAWKDRQRLAEISFQYPQKADPADTVSDYAQRLQVSTAASLTA